MCVETLSWKLLFLQRLPNTKVHSERVYYSKGCSRRKIFKCPLSDLSTCQEYSIYWRYVQLRSVQNLKHASEVQVLIKQKQSSPRCLWSQQESPLKTFESKVAAWLLHGMCFPVLSPVVSGKRSALSLLNWNQGQQGNYSNPGWRGALPLMF